MKNILIYEGQQILTEKQEIADIELLAEAHLNNEIELTEPEYVIIEDDQ